MGSLCVLFGIVLIITQLTGGIAYFGIISYGIWIGAYVSELCVDYRHVVSLLLVSPLVTCLYL